jgi:uncharacterized protein (DUF58 family)
MVITTEGRKFLLLTVLIAVASFNTGNNLIFLILSMMLSILAVSFIVLELNMRGLSLRVSVERPVFARQRSVLDLRISNGKRFLDSYSLRVGLPREMRGEGYVSFVPAGSSAGGRAGVYFGSRGVYQYGDFLLQSSFPFIFLTKALRVGVEGEILVYPEIMEAGAVLWSVYGRGEGAHCIRPGAGDEILGIREMRHGDDIKMVSWRASAKMNKLMAREFAEDGPRTVTVVLDDRRPFDGEAFERAVTLAASVSKELIDGGYFVKLVTSDRVLPPGVGAEHLDRVLGLLAVVRESEGEGGGAPADEAVGSSILVLKSGESSLRKLAPAFDSVLYASNL